MCILWINQDYVAALNMSAKSIGGCVSIPYMCSILLRNVRCPYHTQWYPSTHMYVCAVSFFEMYATPITPSCAPSQQCYPSTHSGTARHCMARLWWRGGARALLPLTPFILDFKVNFNTPGWAVISPKNLRTNKIFLLNNRSSQCLNVAFPTGMFAQLFPKVSPSFVSSPKDFQLIWIFCFKMSELHPPRSDSDWGKHF